MTTGGHRLPSSFRDPHGFVFRRDGIVYRQVNEVHRPDHDALIESGLYDALVARGALIPHEEVDVGLAAAPGATAVLRPEQVPFISYPYEWCFGQLRDAALLTLEIQELALAHGMSLRDASAYNIQFVAGRPLLIDTTSFERRVEGRPWVAYKQFCEHFLAPLALESMRDERIGRALWSFVDGIPLDLAAELLPARSRLKVGIQLHLRMHAKSQSKHEGDASAATPREMSAKALTGVVANLRSTIASLETPSRETTWGGYYEEADHYSGDAADAKERIVRGWIERSAPARVWDLGANTGRYAFVAAGTGAEVVAFDADPAAVERCYAAVRAAGATAVLPLIMDLTNPSPALGWGHRERMSLLERGPADLVLALALIHHLAIGANVPLGMIVDLFAVAGRRAIVEWVPKDDPKVQQMLRTRDDVFPGHTEEAFVREAERRFTVAGRERVPETSRTLFLLEAR